MDEMDALDRECDEELGSTIREKIGVIAPRSPSEWRIVIEEIREARRRFTERIIAERDKVRS